MLCAREALRDQDSPEVERGHLASDITNGEECEKKARERARERRDLGSKEGRSKFTGEREGGSKRKKNEREGQRKKGRNEDERGGAKGERRERKGTSFMRVQF